MNYAVNLEGFAGQDIEARVNYLTGPKLLVNGEPAPKGKKRGEMLLVRNDGRQVVATWRQQILGLEVPQLVLDGQPVNLVQPLKWYELVWSGLPILLVFMGGALGAIAGMVGFIVSSRVFRMDLNPILKYVVSAVVTGLTVIAYFVLAMLFVSAINQ